MNLMPPDDQPEVIIKPETPFFLSRKFLIPGVILILVTTIIIGYSLYIKSASSPKSSPAQIAKEDSIKPLKGTIGTVLAVDSQKSTLTVNSKGKEYFS